MALAGTEIRSGPTGMSDAASADEPLDGSLPPQAGEGPQLGTPRMRFTAGRPAILTTTALAAAAGFAQFGASSALGDVASPSASRRRPGRRSPPRSGLADRLGRRRVMLGCTALGLAITGVAALRWFVALLPSVGRCWQPPTRSAG
jgi:hypothetical protein